MLGWVILGCVLWHYDQQGWAIVAFICAALAD